MKRQGPATKYLNSDSDDENLKHFYPDQNKSTFEEIEDKR
jgi:hypothetical protein